MRHYKEPRWRDLIVEVSAYGVGGLLLIGAIVAVAIFIASIIPVDHIIKAECYEWQGHQENYPVLWETVTQEEIDKMNDQCSDYEIYFSK